MINRDGSGRSVDLHAHRVQRAERHGGSRSAPAILRVTTTAGATVVAPATLSGTVAKIVVTVGGAALGVNVTVPVTVQAEDANNNTVLGNYTNPIALTDTDASGQTSLSSSASNITSGATVVTLAYAGGAMSAPATIGASAAGVSPANVTPGTFSPSQTLSHGQWREHDVSHTRETVTTGTNAAADQWAQRTYRHVHDHRCDRADLRRQESRAR